MRILAALLLLAARSDRETCNIPVFRYALERWRTSPYEIVVFHRGPLEGAARATVDEFRKQSANVDVDHVDLATPLKGRIKTAWEAQKDPAEPWMVALFPGTDFVAWAGPASAEAARLLVDSPARRELARRILSGDTAVWLLLESGEKGKDEAALALLEPELRKLEKSLKLPAHAADDPPIMSDIPVKLAFSTLRVSRADAAEKAFVEMLVRSDTDLKGPVVFPIFGRGRALWAITGAGLTADTIGEAAAFLAGPCACEAKELNPGLDLLVAQEWEQALAFAREDTLKPIPIPEIPKAAAPEPPKAGGIPSPPPPSPPDRTWLLLSIAGAVVLVLVTGTRAFRRA